MSLTPAELAAIIAFELSHNQHTAAIYAAVLGGVVCFSSIVHLTGLVYRKSGYQGTFSRALSALPRIVQRVCLRRVTGFRSVGHTAALAVYLGINITLTLTNMNFLWPWSFLAIRCGWMAVINMSFTFFLALKNTPLSFLAGSSYEKLNILHRWTGRTTFIFLILHVALVQFISMSCQTTKLSLPLNFLFLRLAAFKYYLGCFSTWLAVQALNIASYSAQDELYTLLLIEQIHGQIAFASLTLLVLFSISAFRTRFYELFYKLHVFLYLMIVINVGMHQPVLAVRVVPIISTIGSMSCLDRLYRTVRMLYSSWGNRVTLSAMPDGATKIVFERHIHCTPGSHAFVWIPSIRAFETHPFTISSPSQTQFLVRKQKGFTADLNQYALQHPNVQLRAFFDGPYGAVPNFRDLDKVILLAGGSGASFTCAIAIDLISQPTPMKTKAVEFVWTIKDKSHMIWFEIELEQLRASDLVNVTILVTNDIMPVSEDIKPKSLESGLEESRYIEDIEELKKIGITSASPLSRFAKGDVEAIGSGTTSPASFHLQKGRPDIRATISLAVLSAASEESVGIAACGPKNMMVDTRSAVASLTRIGGPSIRLHTEQFGFA